MEYLVLGIILFIVGIGCTYVYDHFKAEVAEHGGFFKAKPNTPTSAPRKTKPVSTSQAEAEFDRVFTQHMAKMRSQSRPAGLSAKDVSINSTMTVEELIKRLEKMKKDL